MSLKSFVMLAALATSSAFEVSSRVLSAPRAVQRTQARCRTLPPTRRLHSRDPGCIVALAGCRGATRTGVLASVRAKQGRLPANSCHAGSSSGRRVTPAGLGVHPIRVALLLPRLAVICRPGGTTGGQERGGDVWCVVRRAALAPCTSRSAGEEPRLALP